MTKAGIRIGAGLLAVAALGGSAAGAGEAEGARTVRVGTYDSRSVALAWGRSKAGQEAVERAVADHKRAKEEGSEVRARDIEIRMEALQNLRHMQVFGNAPILDMIESMKDIVREEARKAGVDLVVRDIDIAYRAEGVECVDLTPALIGRCDPTDRTREIIRQMKDHPPLPLEVFPIDEEGGRVYGEPGRIPEKEAACAAAKRWLALLDAGSYGESWPAASAHFREVVPRDRWVPEITGLRAGPGELRSRALDLVEYTTDLGDAPPGEYVWMRFKTSFAKKDSAVETVICVREKDGWRVDGYYLK
ncbi:MAG: DUF4019 domain-containing protein [Planctomycetes bacterium]|nr:DUF4019 domain-containing protein [Planctomycetota bacterium]